MNNLIQIYLAIEAYMPVICVGLILVVIVFIGLWNLILLLLKIYEEGE